MCHCWLTAALLGQKQKCWVSSRPPLSWSIRSGNIDMWIKCSHSFCKSMVHTRNRGETHLVAACRSIIAGIISCFFCVSMCMLIWNICYTILIPVTLWCAVLATYAKCFWHKLCFGFPDFAIWIPCRRWQAWASAVMFQDKSGLPWFPFICTLCKSGC